MDVTDLIKQVGGLQQVASELGISPQQAQTGVTALLPAVLGGIKKQTQAAGGLGGLGGVLSSLGGGGLLDNVLGSQPTNVDLGHNVLGQIFGGQHVNQAVTNQAATQTGLDPAMLSKLLPIVAMLATGFLAKQHSAVAAPAAAAAPAGGGGLGGGLGGLLGGLLGGGGSAQASAAGGALGGLGKLLDMDGDGNPLDDILGMASKLGH